MSLRTYQRPFISDLVQKRSSILLALLVCNCAGSLAGRLTRSLTLSAAALSSRSLEVSFIDSFDMLHIEIPPNYIFYYYII